MRYAILENNRVINFAVADEPLDSNWVEVASECDIGMEWDGEKFKYPELPTEILIEQINRIRKKKLSDSDWIVNRAYDQAEPVPQAWAQYRQALRDLPTQPGYPRSIVWPTEPVASAPKTLLQKIGSLFTPGA